MKIVITGGAGFIGSHIVDAYLAKGHKVVIIDNLTTGSKKNINPKAKFYLADIRDFKKIKNILEKEKPQIINHHAAVAQVANSLKNPLLTFEVNIMGTASLLAAAENIKINKFIFSSSGAVYGDSKIFPVKEESPLEPSSAYGTSKLIGEELIKFYSRRQRFNYLIFRYANIFGPRQNPKNEAGIFPIFISLIKNNIRPTIFGKPDKTTRDYVYVGDIARANIIALNKGKNAIFNLGSGKETSNQQVFDAIAKELNFKKKPFYSSLRPGEIKRSALSAKKADKIINWIPEINVKNGLKKTVEFFNG
ncbi:MAG: NAD-dependent epimerase/dehydratase family protein [Patescibacteria group bacterium]|nr:NAD-dependent epimerase/dehydratase family protein [Patescibacteria group bacterium]